MRPKSCHLLGIIILVSVLFPSRLSAKDEARQLYEEGNYKEAIRKYDHILREHPDWEEAHFGKGAALYKQEQLEEALREFELSLATKDPVRKATVFYNMANAFLKKGRLEESLQFYKRALELNPRDFDAKHNFELVRRMLQQNQQSQSQQKQNKKNQDQKEQQQNQSQKQQQKDQQQQRQEQSSRQEQEPQESQPQQQQSRREKEQSKKEAAQILDALKENEKNLMQERMKTKYSGIKKEKDW